MACESHRISQSCNAATSCNWQNRLHWPIDPNMRMHFQSSIQEHSLNPSWHIKNLSGQKLGTSWVWVNQSRRWSKLDHFTTNLSPCSHVAIPEHIYQVISQLLVDKEFIKHSPVLFLYAVCVSAVRLEGPEYCESPLSENWGEAELRLQSLILEKVWEWGRLPRCIEPVRNSLGWGGGSWS